MKYLIFLLVFVTQAVSAASHHPSAFLERIKDAPDEGEQIVQHFCNTCHAVRPVIPIGAPRRGVLKDWSERIKQGKDVLFLHTNEGLRAMPPRGGCFECTDEQLKRAIEALLPKE